MGIVVVFVLGAVFGWVLAYNKGYKKGYKDQSGRLEVVVRNLGAEIKTPAPTEM